MDKQWDLGSLSWMITWLPARVCPVAPSDCVPWLHPAPCFSPNHSCFCSFFLFLLVLEFSRIPVSLWGKHRQCVDLTYVHSFWVFVFWIENGPKDSNFCLVWYIVEIEGNGWGTNLSFPKLWRGRQRGSPMEGDWSQFCFSQCPTISQWKHPITNHQCVSEVKLCSSQY